MKERKDKRRGGVSLSAIGKAFCEHIYLVIPLGQGDGRIQNIVIMEENQVSWLENGS